MVILIDFFGVIANLTDEQKDCRLQYLHCLLT